jgi:hypothetical protein
MLNLVFGAPIALTHIDVVGRASSSQEASHLLVCRSMVLCCHADTSELSHAPTETIPDGR